MVGAKAKEKAWRGVKARVKNQTKKIVKNLVKQEVQVLLRESLKLEVHPYNLTTLKTFSLISSDHFQDLTLIQDITLSLFVQLNQKLCISGFTHVSEFGHRFSGEPMYFVHKHRVPIQLCIFKKTKY